MHKYLKQFKAVTQFADKSGTITLDDDDAVKYQDILEMMKTRGCLRNVNIDGANVYIQMSSFKVFEEWLKLEIKDKKKLNRREWRIAIVSALIGAFIGLIPFFVELATK